MPKGFGTNADSIRVDSHLQCENFSLRQQLEGLLNEARLNEEKMLRFDQLERRLIGAESLAELIDLLLAEYKLAFAVEFVTLALVDRSNESARMLEEARCDLSSLPGLTLLPDASLLQQRYGQATLPWLGPYGEAEHGALFNAQSGEIASVALLPLIRHGELIGSLHFGSANPSRYSGSYGTRFLERLAAIIAVCLENTRNQERLKRVGLTDGLTGVQNRRYFEHRCQVEISQARRYKHPLVCMFLDIDRFKRINDTHGHQTGDEVLRKVAGLVQAQLRAGDTIARYGGEEFVVLLPQTAGHHGREIAERIRNTIAQSHFEANSGHELSVTLSIGLSTLLPEQAVTNGEAEQLIARADQALYQAKHGGRNRVVSAESEAGTVADRGFGERLWLAVSGKIGDWWASHRPLNAAPRPVRRT